MFTFPVASCDEMSMSDGDCCDCGCNCFEEDGRLEILTWGGDCDDNRVYEAVEDGSFRLLMETGAYRLTGEGAEEEE